jgi:hypothetical protein
VFSSSKKVSITKRMRNAAVLDAVLPEPLKYALYYTQENCKEQMTPIKL